MPKQQHKPSQPEGESIPRITDVAGVEPLTPAIPLRDLLNAELTILGFEQRQGDYGPFAILTCLNRDGEQIRVTTGAAAVLRKLQAVQEKGAFPVKARVVKIGRLYDLQ